MHQPKHFRPDYLVFSLLFTLGVIGGQLIGGLIDASRLGDLAGYLHSYSQAVSGREGPAPAAVLFAYFRLPALLLALSMIPWGAWLVLPVLAGHGFLLSLAVRWIATALGRGGLPVAFAAFGVRCCFVLPCCFYLASVCGPFSAASRSAASSSGRYGARRRVLLSAAVCAAVLLAGCAAELSLVPRLFAWAMARIS